VRNRRCAAALARPVCLGAKKRLKAKTRLAWRRRRRRKAVAKTSAAAAQAGGMKISKCEMLGLAARERNNAAVVMA